MYKEEMLARLLEELEKLNAKQELAAARPEDWFEPGMMQNLDQYGGEYREAEGVVILRTEVKGLRYENRTPRLDRLAVGNHVRVLRDPDNRYNPNNFTVENEFGENLGNLPAELCNALAPLTDSGAAELTDVTVSYLEKLLERSRYAKQGVLFLQIEVRLS